MKATERHKLIERIKQIDGLTDDERSALIGILNETKTYGLVWEDKPEDVEERLREELPVLTEVKDRAIISDNLNAPNHVLIEGDNLEALTTLAYTHEGKIDVIFIDPPYNTGNSDFCYNDRYINSDDEFRHSKWLSFMFRRLKIAKKLLSKTGIIFISIDDNEVANLKLLCDDNKLLGEKNFITTFLWRKKSTTSNVRGADVSSLCDYILCYRKTNEAIINPRIKSSNTRSFPLSDSLGNYRTTVIEKKDAGAYQRDSMKFPILGHYPRPGKRWQIGESKARELESKERFIFDGEKILLKIYDFEQEDTKSAQPNLLLEHGSTDSSARLVNNEILGIPELFSNPKPIELISHLINIASSKMGTILDFFAGSGTTLHATMQLNAEDGGHRTCILCTSNENNICEEVTYERNKRVIEGYTKPNGDFVEGLHNNNLRYYKTDFVSRKRSPKNRRELMDKSTSLLCIKEDLYDEKTHFGRIKLNPRGARYFEKEGHRMLIIYHEEFVPFFVEEIEKMEPEQPIKVYVYSAGKYAYDDEFATVSEKVSLCALPHAIIMAMSRVLPEKTEKNILEKAVSTIELKEESPTTLFDFTETEQQ